jgi:hypothetical protein
MISEFRATVPKALPLLRPCPRDVPPKRCKNTRWSKLYFRRLKSNLILIIVIKQCKNLPIIVVVLNIVPKVSELNVDHNNLVIDSSQIISKVVNLF